MKTKAIVLGIYFTLTLVSCKEYIQVFQTASSTSKFKNNPDQWIFENDTVSIQYSFWWKDGVLAFSIFNKLDQPLFIDWKNSSYIANNMKLNYWSDESKTNESTTSNSYHFIDKKFTLQGLQVSSTASTTSKPERITFIPPKSQIDKFTFLILPAEYYLHEKSTQKSVENRNDKPKKKTTVFTENMNEFNTPLKFRNYLCFSTSEEFKDRVYYDNSFYISQVVEMDIRHFRGDKSKFKNQKAFYKYPDSKSNVPYRVTMGLYN